MDSDVGILPGESARNVIDIATAPIIVEHSACRKPVLDDGQVEYGRDRRIVVAAGGGPITRRSIPFGFIQLGFVGDISNDTGFGTAAEERPLRSLQDLYSLHIGRVHVQIATRKLPGLLVQIDGHVWE